MDAVKRFSPLLTQNSCQMQTDGRRYGVEAAKFILYPDINF